MKELLKHGARITTINAEGMTALYFAKQNRLGTLEKLLTPSPANSRSRSA